MPIDDEDRVEDLGWFHPNLNRHHAEALLIQNGQDGSYLLRHCTSEKADYVLSCRCVNSVKHFQIKWDGKFYKFGMGLFSNFSEFVKHFENKPLIGGESGVLTLLKYPYPRYVDEPSCYDSIFIHAELGNGSTTLKARPLSISSKEGYLTKQGLKIKSWRTRWFVLFRDELLYYKTKGSKQPLGILDLNVCLSVKEDEALGKDHAFSVQMPYRTYYIYAVSDSERQEWVNMLKWKLVKSPI